MRAEKDASSEALIWISFVRLSVRSSTDVVVVAMSLSPPTMRSCRRFLFGLRLGAHFDTPQLVLPQAFERGCPGVQRFESPRVGAVEHSASVATCFHQTYFSKHAEVLRDRRLLEV